MNSMLSGIGIAGVMFLAALGLGALLTKLPKWLAGTLVMAGVCAVLTPLALSVVQEPVTCYEEEPWIYYEEDMPWDYEDEDMFWDYDEDDAWYFEEEDPWGYYEDEDWIPKTYYYSGNTVDGKTIIDFSIALYPDGTYTWYETPISSMIGIGTYVIEDDILTMTDDADFTGASRVNRFLMTEDSLVFIAEGSSNFLFVQLEDGEEFYYEVNPVEGWMEEFAD